VFHLSFFMLQLLHLDVSKVDRVLHMGCTWEAVDSVGDVQGCPERRGPTASGLARESNALGARSLLYGASAWIQVRFAK
jgi:hypothetical protein